MTCRHASFSKYMDAADEEQDDDGNDEESEGEDNENENEIENRGQGAKQRQETEGHDQVPAPAGLFREPSLARNIEVTFEEYSDPPSLDERQVSRSPPKSRSPSPSSLEKMTASLCLQPPEIKDIVSSDLRKQRARQERKHHSKRGARRGGRPQGSKAKQDVRYKFDTSPSSGVWG